MTRPGPGMDHDLYPFSSLPSRKPLLWPNGAKVAMNVVLHFEHWELTPPPGAVKDPRMRDPIGEVPPALRMWSFFEYGHRVGIFRILDMLDALGVPVTLAAGAAAMDAYPYLTEQFLRRGYEFAAHGIHGTQMLHSGMSIDQEREIIGQSIEAVERVSGKRPVGWIGQDHGESTHTPFLIAEAGLDYLMDWPNDDMPYMLTTEPGLVSLPVQVEWEPVQAIWTQKVHSNRFAKMATDALDTLHEEAVATGSGRYYGLHIRPWIVGKPHIFPHFEKALTHAVQHEGVWTATAAQVATAFRSQTGD